MEEAVLITGGAGFIGSNLVRYLLKHEDQKKIINLDKLTYAGNLENLKDIEGHSQYRFIKGDITDMDLVRRIFKEEKVVQVYHLAAESHVDRSILDPGGFIQTNIQGTYTLLEVARNLWSQPPYEWESCRFLHVSTDEVYGSLGPDGYFTEESPYQPNSPYAASKASSDMLARAYFKTYGLPVLITNCCNNYGPYQFPEKLIPLMIRNALKNEPLPVYGDGMQVRDWIYVEDHCRGLELVMNKGVPGETYCIGTRGEMTNLAIVEKILALLEKPTSLIRFVKDRPGHDRRYAINPAKVEALGFRGQVSLDEGLKNTIQWYLDHQDWMENITSGAYKEYYQIQYGKRLE
ncbi:MAG: dTDP-glucose 4,6-dehydratase [Planctomycetota bacterium]|nr:MAG: dTDP-glucose 4,6-dehydratase [Planctomycetota bacterium]